MNNKDLLTASMLYSNAYEQRGMFRIAKGNTQKLFRKNNHTSDSRKARRLRQIEKGMIQTNG